MLRLLCALGLAMFLASPARAGSPFYVPEAIKNTEGGSFVFDAKEIGKDCLPQPSILKDKLLHTLSSSAFRLDESNKAAILIFNVSGKTPIDGLCFASFELDLLVRAKVSPKIAWAQGKHHHIRAFNDKGLEAGMMAGFEGKLESSVVKLTRKFLRKWQELRQGN